MSALRVNSGTARPLEISRYRRACATTKSRLVLAALIWGVNLFISLRRILMKILAQFSAVALLFAVAFSSQSTSAAETLGGGFLGSFPF